MRILCFGDSNTYGYDPRSYFGGRYSKEDRWVDLLAEKAGWEVINAGENGREIPWRDVEIQRFVQLLNSHKPDQLLVMLGGNDLLQGADAFEASHRMERFLSMVPMKNERIMLVCPPPMKAGAWVTEARLISESQALAAAYQIVAKGLGTKFIDTSAWEIDLTFDGVHFSQQGHRVFAEKLSEAIAENAGK